MLIASIKKETSLLMVKKQIALILSFQQALLQGKLKKKSLLLVLSTIIQLIIFKFQWKLMESLMLVLSMNLSRVLWIMLNQKVSVVV
jgi:hypothetical protein